MRVACPHCRAEYNIDDRRVPPAGLDVKCPKCQKTFPVRRKSGDDGLSSTAVPLSAPVAPPATVPQAPHRSIPLPPPPPDPAGGFTLPPLPGSAPAVDAARAAPPLRPTVSRFATIDPASPGEPFPVPVPPSPATAPLDFGEVDLDAGDLPAPGASPAAGAERAFEPDPFPAAPAASAGGSSGAPDPFVAPRSGGAGLPPAPLDPPSARPAPSGPDLEMLYGEGGKRPAVHAAPAGPAPAGYRVRRRSGKVFGPFSAAQIVEMLEKAELLGNEDVCADGGQDWAPIGSFPPFAEAVRRYASQAEARARPGARAPPSTIGHGERMARGEVVEGGDAPPTRRRRVPVAIAGAVVLAVGAVGGAGALTRHGPFFWRALRAPGDAAKVAPAVDAARVALARDTFAGAREALALAEQALAAGPEDPRARAVLVLAVTALDRLHAAPPGALARARAEADALGAGGKRGVLALAAKLALAPGGDTALEAQLQEALTRDPPDREAVALLARAALARGDAARAAEQYQRLAALEPDGARARHGLGLALARRGQAPEARASLETALAKDPEHLSSRLEIAVLLAEQGDAEGAKAQLAPLLVREVAGKLGPAERGRALALQGALLARRAQGAAEADQAYEAAIAADDALEHRIALARLRLRRGDPARALAVLDPVASSAADRPDHAEARIDALVQAGRALDATNLVDAALAKNPGYWRLLLEKGRILERSGKPQDAARLYADAAARAPDQWEPHLAAGMLAAGVGDAARAEREVLAALEKWPREPKALVGLGFLRLGQRNLAAAESAFRTALSIDPDSARAELGLGRVAAAREDLPAARAAFDRAAAIAPGDPETMSALGTLLFRSGDLAGAEKTLRAAADLAPRDAATRVALGEVLLQRGDLDAALSEATGAASLDPGSARGQLLLGRVLLARNEASAAQARFRRAAELEPRSAEDRLWLGMALERTGALGEAVDAYREAAAADPKRAEAQERLGLLFAGAGRCEEAVPAFEKAIALAPRLSRLWISLGDCKAKLGKSGEALRIFREVLRKDRSAVGVPYRIARVVHEVQGLGAAVPWYERAALEEKGNAMPHYYLGYHFKQRGQRRRAIQEFRAYLAAKPDADDRKDIEGEIEDLGGR